MLRTIAAMPSLLAFALASAGLVSTGDAGTAVALVLASVVFAVLALVRRALPGAGGRSGSLSCARRSIDISVALTQSDPGAPGHSRPRAPGFAASAA
ncbi:DUF6412 domain-containing protein [Microbacterium sp. DT81.1]|uniref:DUF6412 domain-containing protein n=1 Tax=Microbacterium sp. DT81.1 TaxID=3393413 RepID=UPI003CF6F930